MTDQRRFVHPGEDTTFVRRCRIITAAIVRIASLVLSAAAVVPLVLFFVGGSMLAAGGASTGAVVATLVTGFLPLIAAAFCWFSAGWLAARIFPMPPSRSQCPKCKYPIGDLDADTCPECGTRVR